MKYILPILMMAMVTSCGIPEIFTKPTARELYIRTLDDVLADDFKSIGSDVFSDNVLVNAPFAESKILDPSESVAFGLTLQAHRGERLQILLNSTNVLIDVFKVREDSVRRFDAILEPEFLAEEYELDVNEDGLFFLRLQSKYSATDTVELKILKKPQFAFPVSGGKNADIGSFWGDPRDGGKRKHKGIDIFAKKGTPLVAAVDGRVRSVRERGLGGKQVWLYDSERELSLYYAHLDSQYVSGGEFLRAGDTLGTVGNTGNAKRTPPHLHFAIYVPRKGAIDPINYVRTQKKKSDNPVSLDFFQWEQLMVNKNEVNVRIGPDKKASLIKKAERGDRFSVIGVAGKYIHVRDAEGRVGYIYHTSVSPGNPT